MKNRAMSHRNIIFNNDLGTGKHMNNGIVLDIGVIADDDRPEIGADGNTGSNQAFVTNFLRLRLKRPEDARKNLKAPAAFCRQIHKAP